MSIKYKHFIFITNTVWSGESPRCRHQIALECGKIGKVYFIQQNNSKLESNHENIIPVNTPASTTPRKLQILIPFLKKAEDIKLNSMIKDLIKTNQFDIKETLIINFRYDFSFFDNLNVDFIYVCNDEFTSRYKWPLSSLLSRHEKKLAKKAKACFGISTVLLNKLKSYNTNSYLFKPGITQYEFTPNQTITKNKLIKVCYGGFINDRLNFSILEKILASNEIELEIFGPIHGKNMNEKLEQLKTLGLKVSEPKNFVDFITYLDQFDVLIAPYNITAGTSAIGIPNKALQYLQIGKPVVISNLPYLDKSLEGIIKITDQLDWVKEIKSLHENNSIEKIKERIDFANEHTWEKSLKGILKETVNL